jgi:hypothetical protein
MAHVDTIVGCAFAVAARYVLWPRDHSTKTPVPVPT